MLDFNGIKDGETDSVSDTLPFGLRYVNLRVVIGGISMKMKNPKTKKGVWDKKGCLRYHGLAVFFYLGL